MIDPDTIDWSKGLVPAVVQCADSGSVRMLGYMNRDALEATFASGRVTFWSRSRDELWEKGATSGNALALVDIRTDCDRDALLVTARPAGPTCHLGSESCFGDAPSGGLPFLAQLSAIIAARAADGDEGSSYTARLLAQGPKRIAQKIGEEGVEVALAATGEDDAALSGEIADLLYHVAVLLEARGIAWSDAIDVLRERHDSSATASR